MGEDQGAAPGAGNSPIDESSRSTASGFSVSHREAGQSCRLTGVTLQSAGGPTGRGAPQHFSQSRGGPGVPSPSSLGPKASALIVDLVTRRRSARASSGGATIRTSSSCSARGRSERPGPPAAHSERSKIVRPGTAPSASRLPWSIASRPVMFSGQARASTILGAARPARPPTVRGRTTPPRLHQWAALLQQVGARIGGLGLVPDRVGQGALHHLPASVRVSPAQSRNVLRNPCAVIGWPVRASRHLTAFLRRRGSARGQAPRCHARSRDPLPARKHEVSGPVQSGSTARSTASAAGESGTRCSRSFLPGSARSRPRRPGPPPPRAERLARARRGQNGESRARAVECAAAAAPRSRRSPARAARHDARPPTGPGREQVGEVAAPAGRVLATRQPRAAA